MILLPTLLHHANRHSKDSHFYAIKKSILLKYTDVDGCDVQHIEGKQCFSCNGTGDFYHWSGDTDICFKCAGTGMFKDPFWSVLQRYKFGKYTFHQPLAKVYKKPNTQTNIINGYISHKDTKYGGYAVMILYLLFDFKYFIYILKDDLSRWYWYRVQECKRYYNKFTKLFESNHVISETDAYQYDDMPF